MSGSNISALNAQNPLSKVCLWDFSITLVLLPTLVAFQRFQPFYPAQTGSGSRLGLGLRTNPNLRVNLTLTSVINWAGEPAVWGFDPHPTALRWFCSERGSWDRS